MNISRFANQALQQATQIANTTQGLIQADKVLDVARQQDAKIQVVGQDESVAQFGIDEFLQSSDQQQKLDNAKSASITVLINQEIITLDLKKLSKDYLIAAMKDDVQEIGSPDKQELTELKNLAQDIRSRFDRQEDKSLFTVKKQTSFSKNAYAMMVQDALRYWVSLKPAERETLETLLNVNEKGRIGSGDLKNVFPGLEGKVSRADLEGLIKHKQAEEIQAAKAQFVLKGQDIELDPNNPMTVEYWNNTLEQMGQWHKNTNYYVEFEHEALQTIRSQIEIVAHNVMDAEDIGQQLLDPKIVEENLKAMNIAAETSQAVIDKRVAEYENLSQNLGTAIQVAEVTRDASALVVNKVAEKADELGIEPLASQMKALSTGMNAALAFIDAVGKGEDLGSATLQAAVAAVLTNVSAGDNASMKKEVGVLMGKIITQLTADLASGRIHSGQEFVENFLGEFAKGLGELGLGQLMDDGPVKELALILYDQFLEAPQIDLDGVKTLKAKTNGVVD